MSTASFSVSHLRMLLAAYDAAILVHHEIRLDEATGRVVSRSVPNLATRTNCLHLLLNKKE